MLLHGCHLQADLNGRGWEEIEWGSHEGATLDGRGTMAIKVAMDTKAKFIIFSTGASERGGLKEGEYTRQVAFGRAAQIGQATGYDTLAVESYLSRNYVLDLESMSTRDECERNLRLCAERGITHVTIVSSAWHLPRCLIEALRAAEILRNEGLSVPEIAAVASHGSTEGIVVFEPPHRGDQPKHGFLPLVQKFFKVPAAQWRSFEDALAQLLKLHGAP